MNIPPYDPANPLDELTGLLKRTWTLAEIEKLIAGGKEFSLVLADIDRCAYFNNDYGHVAGDSAIRSLGQSICGAAGEGAIVGRVAGDKYLICLPDTAASAAHDAAQRMGTAARAARVEDYDGKAVSPPSLTFAVAAFPEHGHHLEALNAALDEAVRAGKHAGGNRVVVAQHR